MTTKLIKYSVLPLSLCATSMAFGQATTPTTTSAAADATIQPVTLEPKSDSLNRVSIGFQLGFNLNAKFKHIGKFPASSNPGSTNGLSDHFYDDGYNRVDGTGNQHFAGFDGDGNPVFTQGTWHWGFSGNGTPDINGNGNQVHNNGEENGTIDMHSTSSAGGSSGERDNDPAPGLELNFSRELFRDDQDRWRAGLEGSFGYTDLNIKDSSTVNAKATQLTDTYSLFGTTVPTGSGYNQNVDGDPNHIIIGDVPTRSISQTAVPVSGTRKFGADLFAFKVGPYFEVPLNKTFSFSLEGGLAMVYVYSQFHFNEIVATPGGALAVNGHGANDGIQVGGYLGGRINAALNDQWSLFAGAQWQDVGSYVHKNRPTGESAVLDLSQAVFFTAGVGYSF